MGHSQHGHGLVRDHRGDVTPRPEPSREPFDSHMPPLDVEDDARWLDPSDPRRLEIERRRGRPFLAGD